MTNMKTIFMVILMVLVSFNASAQISRTIMGMTLGVSTPEQCAQIMERKGIKLRGNKTELVYGGEDQIVTFAGTNWHSFQLKFYKGKLCDIVFQLVDRFDKDDEMSVGNTLISYSLNRKYSKYRIDIGTGNLTSRDVFIDGRTTVKLFYQERNDYKKPYLGLGYKDNALSEARNREELKFIDKDL